jgi:formylglycine-generating enzyme required for sulfatase activity
MILLAEEPLRIWTDLQGRSIEASFIKFSGNNIVIKMKSGRDYEVAPSLFSPSDQKYLSDLKKSTPEKTIVGKNEYFKGATIVVSAKGEVFVDDQSKTSATPTPSSSSSESNSSTKTKIEAGDILPVGSLVTVGSDSETILLFSNGTITTVGENTHMIVRMFFQDGFEKSEKKVADLEQEISSSTLLLDLVIGDLVVDVRKLRKTSNFEITTRLGVAGIRGTQFQLVALDKSTELAVLTGKVNFTPSSKETRAVDTGKGILAQTGKELSIGDLGEAQKQSIAQTIAKAKDAAKEISLSTLRDKLGGQFKVHLVPSVKNMEMIWVEPGTFMMGSQTKLRKVELTKGFYLGKYEVTQAQFEILIGENPSKLKGRNQPVDTVSWDKAISFCRRLSMQESKAGRLPAGWQYTLPTSAESEYACRAGTQTAYSWGDEITGSQPGRGVPRMYTPKLAGRTYKFPEYFRDRADQEVGLFAPNPWGFYDMHGSVSEWTSDWDGWRHIPLAVDPIGPKSGSQKVFRGGSSAYGKDWLHSGMTDSDSTGTRRSSLGFRVALKKTE